MNRLLINLDVLRHNIEVVDGWMQKHGAGWTLVTKVLCGHADTLSALQQIGVRSMADSRLINLQSIERVNPEFEAWYLRLPHMSAIPRIVELADISLNSEIETIKALNARAIELDTIHRVVIMIELGDLREGILPGTLVEFYEAIFELSNIDILGIGANLGCLAGAVPNIDQVMQLVLYKELLELKFKRPLPMISGGSSSLLPLLLDGQIPKAINHFRIGESVFLGSNLVHGGELDGLRGDAFTLETEIVEIKEKSLIAPADTMSFTPFQSFKEEKYEPGQRGHRALVTMGQLDTEMTGLTPVYPEYKVVGASSDVSVIYLGNNPRNLKVGDSIKFRPSYGALARLMIGPYVDKIVTPTIEQYGDSLDSSQQVEVPRVVPNDIE
jgi:ornithine racemase